MKTNSPSTIIGAGLAGLLAGSVFPRAKIFERGSEQQASHKAVLRFRTPAVGEAVGVEFKKVTVHKGIWANGFFARPNIQLANLYSKKVINRYADRSIWKIEPSERFIAPEDLIEQMVERCARRIEWDCSVGLGLLRDASNAPIVSTIPMNLMCDMVMDPNAPCPDFKFAPITVRRWRIPDADVFQTVYFPDPETNLYRVSITKGLMIAEYMNEADSYHFFDAFGLNSSDCVALDNSKQRYGKIAEIDNDWRRSFIHHLSSTQSIYSVGRFATWRNLILDEVIHDLHVVKKLIASSEYDRMKVR